jgi:hypothetical protein
MVFISSTRFKKKIIVGKQKVLDEEKKNISEEFIFIV